MNLILDASSILVCTQPVDFRRSIDGLIDIVVSAIDRDPKKGIFVFYNRTQTKLKILAWHHNGFVLLLKRLEKNRFFNLKNDVAISVTPLQLSWLLAGLDWITMSKFGELKYDDFH